MDADAVDVDLISADFKDLPRSLASTQVPSTHVPSSVPDSSTSGSTGSSQGHEAPVAHLHGIRMPQSEELRALSGRPPPPAVPGSLLKQGRGVWKSWRKCFVVLREGRLHWSKTEMTAERPADIGPHAIMDFSRTPCEVLASEHCDGRLILRPLPGHCWDVADWQTGVGTSQPLMLDAGQRRNYWLQSIRDHVAYGRVKGAERLQRSKVGCIPDALGALDPKDLPVREECAICLMELQVDGQQHILKACCGHVFHSDCVFHWLQTATSCPVCRAELFTEVEKKRRRQCRLRLSRACSRARSARRRTYAFSFSL